MIDFRSLPRSDLEALMQAWGQPAFRGRQLFRWLWRPGFRSLSELTEFPKGLRSWVSQKGCIYRMEAVQKQCSLDGTVKWAFRLRDGVVIETVLIPERDHTTICLSTQAGCAMGCAFCHTARMGFSRNLLPSEIAGQVLAVAESVPAERRPRNIVFMGMGEPLANFDNVIKTIRVLTDGLGLDFSQRRITVSTCGLVPEIYKLGETVEVGLAVSLHATTDRIRNRLMPINRVYPIEKLLGACKRFKMPKRRRITFEYLLIKEINDSEQDARRLAGLLKGIRSKINIIPYNYCPEAAFEEPDREAILRFQDILKSKGLTAVIRKSRGRDIEAACGQLCSDRGNGLNQEGTAIMNCRCLPCFSRRRMA